MRLLREVYREMTGRTPTFGEAPMWCPACKSETVLEMRAHSPRFDRGEARCANNCQPDRIAAALGLPHGTIVATIATPAVTATALATAKVSAAAPVAADDDTTPGIAAVPSLDASAFVGRFGEYVRAIAPGTEASAAAVLIALLIGFGTMVGRGPHQFLGSVRHGCALFGLLVGTTGRGRKTTALHDARHLLALVDPPFWARSSPRVLSGFGSGEALTARLAPTAGATSATDTRLFVVENEFGAVMSVKGREGNTYGLTLRNAWDGEPLSNQTKSANLLVPEHHIGLIGAITAEELRETLTATDRSSGFGNRFLYLHAQQSQILPHSERPGAAVLDDYVVRLSVALERARLDREIPLTPEGMAWWSDWYRDWSERPPEDRGVIQLTQRAAPQLRRLALVYALADGRTAVDRTDLEAAAAIIAFSQDTVAYIFPPVSQLPPLARKILDALGAAGESGLSRSAIRTDVIGSNDVKASDITSALQAIHSRGLASMTREPSERGGRPPEVWRLARFAPRPAGPEGSNGRNGSETTG